MSDQLYLDRLGQKQTHAELHGIATWLADDVNTVVIRQTRYNDPSSDKVTTGTNRETPLPYNETAAFIAQEMRNVLRYWTEQICTQRRLPWPGEHRSATYAKWIARHIIALALCDGAQEAADDIHRVWNDAHRIVDTPEHSRYQGACQICGNDLWAKPNDRDIVCRGCTLVIDRDANDTKINQALEARFYTVNELVDIVHDRLGMTIKPKTIHDMAYKRRNPLAVRGRTYDGQKLYRAGDVFTRIQARKVNS